MVPGDTLPPAEHGPLGQQPASSLRSISRFWKTGTCVPWKGNAPYGSQSFDSIFTMETKSTVKEKAKAYLESLSEKQKRGILIAMLVFTCVASGRVVLLRAAGG